MSLYVNKSFSNGEKNLFRLEAKDACNYANNFKSLKTLLDVSKTFKVEFVTNDGINQCSRILVSKTPIYNTYVMHTISVRSYLNNLKQTLNETWNLTDIE